MVRVRVRVGVGVGANLARVGAHLLLFLLRDTLPQYEGHLRLPAGMRSGGILVNSTRLCRQEAAGQHVKLRRPLLRAPG